MFRSCATAIRWITALLLCVTAAAVSAEVYKWTDAEGNAHFGDRPPQSGAQSVPLREQPAAPAATPEERMEKQRKLLHAFEEERRQKRDAAEKSRQDKAERQRNCIEARDNLHSQETASGVYRLGPDGQRIFLNDVEREQSLAAARAAVEEWCGKQ